MALQFHFPYIVPAVDFQVHPRICAFAWSLGHVACGSLHRNSSSFFIGWLFTVWLVLAFFHFVHSSLCSSIYRSLFKQETLFCTMPSMTSTIWHGDDGFCCLSHPNAKHLSSKSKEMLTLICADFKRSIVNLQDFSTNSCSWPSMSARSQICFDQCR